MRLGVIVSALAALAGTTAGTAPDPRVAERFVKVTRATPWTPVKRVPIGFRTFHPQGMVRIDENIYLSAVEIRTLPRKYVTPQNGMDRTAGDGVGHLFKIGPDGQMLADLVLGDGAIYHPGGIDFDGTSIWVPVAEYRPNSRAIVYRVDPKTMTAQEAFRFADHIGGIVRDDDGLHGISWGSRRFYDWPVGADGRVANAGSARPIANPAHYIDYQDCHHAGGRRMLCGGVGEYRPMVGDTPFQLGGIELVDLATHRPIWQVPVGLRSAARVMTQNPFFMEATERGLRAYFVPDDDVSTVFVYDLAVP